MEKTLKNMWLSPPYTTYNNRNLTRWCLQVLLSVSGQRQTLFKMPPAHPYPHCEGLYKYTWLEMHIAALIWYAKHWPHPCIVLHEALRTAAAGPSVIRLLKRGHWDPTSHYSQRHRVKTSIETERQVSRFVDQNDLQFTADEFFSSALNLLNDLISVIWYRYDHQRLSWQ